MENTNNFTNGKQEIPNQITPTTSQAGNALVNPYTNSQTQTTTSQTQAANLAQAQPGKAQAGNQEIKNVIGVFNSHEHAEQAVNALRSQGFTTEEINIVSKNNKQNQNRENDYYEDDITDGALTGGTLGGIGGLLLGAGALAIPGVGPVLAAGPIAAALGGAVAGGIAGGLVDWGIPAEAGRRYEREVAQGGILAIIRSDAAKSNQAAQILRQNGAKDVEVHALT
ncbi:general stress protein [Sporomusa acidovorans]|uniref:General stress protein 17M-like domain-containing protein n=1 Tax=Sporomusa acidovorans (strain ATCC 49682 / DSM 3132 / Mol) TaxID=1123286 RepID=A0ABZ3J3H3_SPOA4|nr:general stress protein [Sporomusa acidovorans]OZC20125.1 hypothetical protein SPACI_25230 [Sporomusa acidovorans DSM 3132]SDD44387.1 Heat induced stress protein YflT [Sporomusa acidovorans]